MNKILHFYLDFYLKIYRFGNVLLEVGFDKICDKNYILSKSVLKRSVSNLESDTDSKSSMKSIFHQSGYLGKHCGKNQD